MIKIFLLAVFLLLPCVGLRAQDERNEIVVLAVVTKISPPPVTLSGDIPSYRLVKYKIRKVIRGEYSSPTMVVDHLVLTGRELNEVRIGDTLKVAVRRVKSLDVRTNAPGIRRESDKIPEFFIVETYTKQKRPRRR